LSRSRPVKALVVAAVTVPLVAVSGYAAGAANHQPRPTQVVPNLPAPAAAPNPLIASGVGIGKNVALYKTSGLGPSGLNTSAPIGTPARFVDTTQFPDGVLPPGVTITEAQALNVLARITENLASAGLDPSDVITMRVFLDNAPGTDIADYAGWNRAYRQFFANTDRVTGAPIDVPLGTAPPAPPLTVNPARPSRFTIEVASLPVAGWLVEIEVDAAYPK